MKFRRSYKKKRVYSIPFDKVGCKQNLLVIISSYHAQCSRTLLSFLDHSFTLCFHSILVTSSRTQCHLLIIHCNIALSFHLLRLLKRPATSWSLSPTAIIAATITLSIWQNQPILPLKGGLNKANELCRYGTVMTYDHFDVSRKNGGGGMVIGVMKF